MRVLTFATSKQKGDNAATGEPPNVVDKDNLKHPSIVSLTLFLTSLACGAIPQMTNARVWKTNLSIKTNKEEAEDRWSMERSERCYLKAFH
jgi:hypothetical protein